MVVLPSDHYIENEKNYVETLNQAVELANRRRGIVTLGIEPTRPETGMDILKWEKELVGILPLIK